MRAVTFQAPGVVSVEERPEPEPIADDDAVVRIEATGVCGSDLHIFHGRVQIEPGFTIGHEYVGTVTAVGEAVARVSVGRPCAGLLPHRLRRLLVLPSRPLPPLPGVAHLRTRCHARIAPGHPGRHGAGAPCRPRAQEGAGGDEQRRRPLRRRRDGDRLSCRRRQRAATRRRRRRAWARACRPVRGAGRPGGRGGEGLRRGHGSRAPGGGRRPRRRAGAPGRAGCPGDGARPPRKAVARTCASTPSATRRRSTWRSASPGPAAASSASASTPSATEVHMGLLWLNSLTLRGGQANVIAHVDRVLAMLSSGVLDPTPLVTRHMSLEEAPEAYAVYDRREALKIVLTP